MDLKFDMFCRVLILVSGIVMALPASADVYRSVDENGHVVFSDKPSPGATKVDIPPPQTMPANQVKNPQVTPSAPKPAPAYKSVDIVSPKDQQAIRANNGDITISGAVTPRLLPGDQLALYLDGKEVTSGNSMTFQLNNLDRGEHQAYLQISDASGQVKVTSATVTFYVLRHSVLHKHPTVPP